MRRLFWGFASLLSSCALFAVPSSATCDQEGAFLGCDGDSLLLCTAVDDELIALRQPCGEGATCSEAAQGCVEDQCGDGIVNPPEQCDGDNLDGQDCTSLGFPQGGDLICSADCSLVADDCLGENCINKIDDDGDGLADCDAPECATHPACAAGTACQDGFLEPGEACFLDFVAFNVDSDPSSIDSADLDNDGDIDLVTANENTDSISVLANSFVEGSLGFGDAVGFPVGDAPRGIALGNLRGDALPDIVTANELDNNISILVNLGDNQFSAPELEPATGVGPFSVALADVNQANGLDIIVPDSGTNEVEVFFNNGAGQFIPAPFSVGVRPESVNVGDIDGDGLLDLVSANFNGGDVTLLSNNGLSDFVFFGSLPVGTSLTNIVLGDLDNSGIDDIVVTSRNDGGVYVLKDNGDPTFTPTDAGAETVELGDLDNDGDVDVVVGHFGALNAVVLLNNGAGDLTAARTLPVSAVGLGDIEIADFNNDNFLDIALIVQNANQIAVYFNEP